jgi:membrane protease YdiL (CAAX protease family)
VRRPTSGRRAVTASVGVVGTALLGKSLRTKADSTAFYVSTAAVAGTWLVGAAVSGPIRLADERTRRNAPRELLVVPVTLAAGMFGLFYLAAVLGRRIPSLDRALTSVLSYAHEGSTARVLSTTLANAVAEEAYFRGAVFDAAGPRRAVPISIACYMLSTTATRNPALVLASGVMGAVFAIQRRKTGGVLAPTITHLTWATLMVRYLPPLFSENASRTARGSSASLAGLMRLRPDRVIHMIRIRS